MRYRLIILAALLAGTFFICCEVDPYVDSSSADSLDTASQEVSVQKETITISCTINSIKDTLDNVITLDTVCDTTRSGPN